MGMEGNALADQAARTGGQADDENFVDVKIPRADVKAKIKQYFYDLWSKE